MTNRVYLIGYSGNTVQRLQRLVKLYDANLVDIRFRAGSRIPQWNKSALVRAFGDRYVHIPALGNSAYKSGGVEIANYASGLSFIRESSRPAILMCACKSPHGCHRITVGQMLVQDGFDVSELNATEAEQSKLLGIKTHEQKGLFDI